MPYNSHRLIQVVVVYLVGYRLTGEDGLREEAQDCEEALVSVDTLESDAGGIGNLYVGDIDAIIQRFHKYERVVLVQCINYLTKVHIEVFGTQPNLLLFPGILRLRRLIVT